MIDQIKREAIFGQIQDLCKLHDWSFEYSDSHEVWKRGNAQAMAIRDLVRMFVAVGGQLQLIVDIIKPNLPRDEELPKYL